MRQHAIDVDGSGVAAFTFPPMTWEEAGGNSTIDLDVEEQSG